MVFRAPLTMDAAEFMPWGDEGEFFVVQGWVPPHMFLQGVMAAMTDMDAPQMIADSIEAAGGPYIVRWYDDDNDKPDDEYEAELKAAFVELHAKNVRYGWVRFWDDNDENKHCEANPFRSYDGGVEVYKGEVGIPMPDEKPQHPCSCVPPWVRATYMWEH